MTGNDWKIRKSKNSSFQNGDRNLKKTEQLEAQLSGKGTAAFISLNCTTKSFPVLAIWQMLFSVHKMLMVNDPVASLQALLSSTEPLKQKDGERGATNSQCCQGSGSWTYTVRNAHSHLPAANPFLNSVLKGLKLLGVEYNLLSRKRAEEGNKQKSPVLKSGWP